MPFLRKDIARKHKFEHIPEDDNFVVETRVESNKYWFGVTEQTSELLNLSYILDALLKNDSKGPVCFGFWSNESTHLQVLDFGQSPRIKIPTYSVLKPNLTSSYRVHLWWALRALFLLIWIYRKTDLFLWTSIPCNEARESDDQ